MTQSSNNPVWDLISQLAEEAKLMKGNEIVDHVRINRGRDYIERFKQEYPENVAYINGLLNTSIPLLKVTLAIFKPEFAQIQHIDSFLTALQKALNQP